MKTIIWKIFLLSEKYNITNYISTLLTEDESIVMDFISKNTLSSWNYESSILYEQFKHVNSDNLYHIYDSLLIEVEGLHDLRDTTLKRIELLVQKIKDNNDPDEDIELIYDGKKILLPYDTEENENLWDLLDFMSVIDEEILLNGEMGILLIST
jgi:hypothetical protein